MLLTVHNLYNIIIAQCLYVILQNLFLTAPLSSRKYKPRSNYDVCVKWDMLSVDLFSYLSFDVQSDVLL